MASLHGGSAISYRRAYPGGTVLVVDGYAVVIEELHCIVAAPAEAEEPLRFEVPVASGAGSTWCVLERVLTEHLTLTEELKLDVTCDRRTFAEAPRIAELAKRFYMESAQLSSEGETRRVAPRVPRAPVAKAAAASWPGLSAGGQFWNAGPTAEDGEDLQEDEDSEQDYEDAEDPSAAAAASSSRFRTTPAPYGSARRAGKFTTAPGSFEDLVARGGMPGLLPNGVLPGAPAPPGLAPQFVPAARPAAAAFAAAAAGRPPAAPSGRGRPSAATGHYGQGAWSGGQTAQPNTGDLVQLEMLRVLQQMQRKGGSGGRREDEDSDSEAEGHGKEFRGIRRARERFKRRPGAVTQRYLDKIQAELGIEHESQYWQCRDYSRKVYGSFGKMKGLWRCHFAASECLQHHVEGRDAHTGAFLALLCQCLHQVALDGGDWGSGALLLPSEDPLSRTPFGGDEQALQEVYTYRKAMRDLKTKQLRKDPGEEEHEEPAAPGGGGGRRPRKK